MNLHIFEITTTTDDIATTKHGERFGGGGVEDGNDYVSLS